ncbi:RNA-directed DNA polymerase [Candidatus Giovannonibacteria bacterium]|nr:RNA-directed DNA polymerase [Candidatus Giovannonibacteria bacterium]
MAKNPESIGSLLANLSAKEPRGSLLTNLLAKISLHETAKLIGTDERSLLRALRLAKRPDGYKRKYIPKKRGGFRPVDAPHDDLKWVQRCLHRNFLRRRHHPSSICHSFVGKCYDPQAEFGEKWRAGRSIVSGAYEHICPGEWRHPRSLFSVDMKDAFPSVTEKRVSAIYKELSGNELVAKVLTNLSVLNNSLPQGAPTSPTLFNLACRELDANLAEEFGLDGRFVITRYADDVTITSVEREIKTADRERLVKVVEGHGFKVNREKDCYWQDWRHVLRVTGINLDPEKRRLFLPRSELDRLRLLAFHSLRVLENESAAWLESKSRFDVPDFLRSLDKRATMAFGRLGGIVGFCSMVYDEQEWPSRLFGWHPALAEWSKDDFHTLLQIIKEGELANPDSDLFDFSP